MRLGKHTRKAYKNPFYTAYIYSETNATHTMPYIVNGHFDHI